MLSYSNENRLHVDIWMADISLDELVDERPVKANLQLKPVAFPLDPEGMWKRAVSARLQVRAPNCSIICLLLQHQWQPCIHVCSARLFATPVTSIVTLTAQRCARSVLVDVHVHRQ